MSFAKIYTRGLLGLHAPQIEVEVNDLNEIYVHKLYIRIYPVSAHRSTYEIEGEKCLKI